MKSFTNSFCLFVFLLVASAHADDQDALIRRIIAETSIPVHVREQLHQKMESTRREHPSLPLATWKQVETEIASTKMEDEMVGVWKGAFSLQELKEIDRFLSTPTGKKFFQVSQTVVPRMAAVAALAGVRVFGVLQTLHPDQFPHDAKSEEQTRQLFETLRQGPRGGK